MKFVHVATRTKDLEAAIAFYELLRHGLLAQEGAHEGQGDAGVHGAAEGNFAIELVYNWGKDDGYEGGERFGHFAFEMDDIDAVLPGILERGGKLVREPYLLEGDGPLLAFVDDPDGNWIELIQRSV